MNLRERKPTPRCASTPGTVWVSGEPSDVGCVRRASAGGARRRAACGVCRERRGARCQRAAARLRRRDPAHSYALLVGVPSNEEPGLLRVHPGVPDSSYIVLKLEGSSAILGAQMPFGGPPLPQSTIDVIRQWISDGAASGRMAGAAAARFAVVATFPEDQAVVVPPVARIVVAFSHELDASLINDTTLHLERLGSDAPEPAGPISLRLAEGNPRALLIIPRGALAAGRYRLTLRGSGGGGGALADVNAHALGIDYVSEFIVDITP